MFACIDLVDSSKILSHFSFDAPAISAAQANPPEQVVQQLLDLAGRRMHVQMEEMQ